jgi:hypothetical protein
MAKYRSLSKRQVAAIKWRRETGEKIARDYPQIAENFRSGWYQVDIAIEYGFAERYGLSSEKIAEDAVGYALKLLMPEKERRRVSIGHQRTAQKESGLKAKKRGDGVFAMTKEEHRKTGMKGAEKIMREKLGIFKPGYERKPSENNIRSHGHVPWTGEQREYFVELKRQGFTYREIADELEKRFGVRREPEYLAPYFYRMIKNRRS